MSAPVPLPRRTSLAIAALVLISGMLPAAAGMAQCSDNKRSEIAKFNSLWTMAFTLARSDEISSLYAEDALFVSLGFEKARSRTEIRAYFDRVFRRYPMGLIANQTMVIDCGDGSDVATASFSVMRGRKGTRLFVGGRVRIHYERRDGRWRIVRQELNWLTGRDPSVVTSGL